MTKRFVREKDGREFNSLEEMDEAMINENPELSKEQVKEKRMKESFRVRS